MNMADSKSSKGLAATGLGTIDCARHNMKLPNGVGDLQKGERYVLFGCAWTHFTDAPILDILTWISYSFQPCATALSMFSMYLTISRASGTRICGPGWQHFPKNIDSITPSQLFGSSCRNSIFLHTLPNVRRRFRSIGLDGLVALMARPQSEDGRTLTR